METSPVLIATPLLTPEPPLPQTVVKTASTCPWGQIKAVEAVSLNDVMSEQLVKVMMEEENPSTLEDTPVYVDDFIDCEDDCSDDHLLAQLLQLELDKEHDNHLKKVESLHNGNSKVTISYGKYRRLPFDSHLCSDEDSDDEDFSLEQSAKNHWHNFEEAEKSFQAVGKSGVSRQGNVTTTKHDPTICGRRNAGKMMESFYPCLPIGDGGKFDMKVSNNVYNSLRQYSVAENKRGKMHDKQEIATCQKAFDQTTNLILFKLLNNETLEALSGCISTGKEACVYHAWSGLPEEESPSSEFAVKVFKTTLNEFHNREQYIRDDHRFRSRFSKLNPRKIIHLWAEKEMRNLMRIKEANIPCPDVIVLKKHVLVMTFIGKDSKAAPEVKNVKLPFEDMTIIYEQTVEIMKGLYSKCKLVHADLSEYNLLWFDDKTWVIDVSQAVEITHPSAFKFLLRDCTNVTNFFQKRGVLNVPKPEYLFFEITGEHPK